MLKKLKPIENVPVIRTIPYPHELEKDKYGTKEEKPQETKKGDTVEIEFRYD